MGVMIFIAINGDALLIRGFAETFELVPLLETPALEQLLDGAIAAVHRHLLRARSRSARR